MHLTNSQRSAINHDGRNLQLIACAGSGKTEIVSRRITHLLSQQDSLSPANILAFTFTDKAAAELKERIVKITREKLPSLIGISEMFVGTIHAFCLDLLKSEVPIYLKFEVLNEVQQSLLIDKFSRRSGLTQSQTLEGVSLKRYTDTKLYSSVLTIVREAELDDEVFQNCSIQAGLDQYKSLLTDESYLDYSAILEKAVEILTNNEEVRDSISKRIRYVVVDEYQDVNPIQETIVQRLHQLGAEICVVGDDDQTIYQWRGSEVENILNFDNRYPDVERVTLEKNFRSSIGIVETARQFIEKNDKRLPKNMTSSDTQYYEKGDLVALPFNSPEEEAEYIVETAKSLRGIAFQESGDERGLSWSDMAVLLRSVKNNGEPITQAFKNAQIPYIVTGMTNLFASFEAEAARQLFCFIGNYAEVNRYEVERAWFSADVGITSDNLCKALDKVEEFKTKLTERRWRQYSIQRVFLEFLENALIRENLVPKNRGELIFYNLGKFSQVISDFESIHYRTKINEKFDQFAKFLHYSAENAYPEGEQGDQHANLDAVRIMTIHQAKGLQWPVVFIPALLRNRFPAKKTGGRTIWHLIPTESVKNHERFSGTVDDERRLFYVAMTRSQKFLHVTWAPVQNNNLYKRASDFFHEILKSNYVIRRLQNYSSRKRLSPTPKAGIRNVVLSFSELKYYFECPYLFRLRVIYGFNTPIDEALGYGKSLHDVLADIHNRAIGGQTPQIEEVPQLIDLHFHAPYAYPQLNSTLKESAERTIVKYIEDNSDEFGNIEFSEKQIEINFEGGITVNGRIDLVRRLDSDEVTIVDLKSSDQAQAENVTDLQLHTYVLGYQELTGRLADYVETYELDEGRRKLRSVDEDFIYDVKDITYEAANSLHNGMFPTNPNINRCLSCDYLGICIDGQNKVG